MSVGILGLLFFLRWSSHLSQKGGLFSASPLGINLHPLMPSTPSLQGLIPSFLEHYRSFSEDSPFSLFHCTTLSDTVPQKYSSDHTMPWALTRLLTLKQMETKGYLSQHLWVIIMQSVSTFQISCFLHQKHLYFPFILHLFLLFTFFIYSITSLHLDY